MKKIFLSNNEINTGDDVQIDDEDYHHLSTVLRVQKNEKFIVQDIAGREFYCFISAISKKSIIIKIEKEHIRLLRKCPKIVILFSLLKGDKNEYLIQKCTELGADSFIPVITKNTIIKIDDKGEKKLNRFKIIAKEAAMQSCREKIPEISNFKAFEGIKNYDINSKRYFGYINSESATLKSEAMNLNCGDTVSFLIGPEGDFTADEIKKLFEWNWIALNISEFILKSETCAISFVSGIYALFYDSKQIKR